MASVFWQPSQKPDPAGCWSQAYGGFDTAYHPVFLSRNHWRSAFGRPSGCGDVVCKATTSLAERKHPQACGLATLVQQGMERRASGLTDSLLGNLQPREQALAEDQYLFVFVEVAAFAYKGDKMLWRLAFDQPLPYRIA